MPTPTVSVLVLAYNQRAFIGDTLESVISQDYPNLEVVVADDGSTDGTSDIVREFARRHPQRVVPLIGEANVGITRNHARGVAACKGEYIAFLGGDDLFLPGKIRAQVDWFAQDSARALCGHDLEVFDSTSGRTLYLLANEVSPFAGRGRELFVRHGCPFAASSIMIRRSRVPAYGFDTRLLIASDYLFWLDCVGDDGVFGYLDGIYARYRRHGGNVTMTKHQEIFEDTLVTLALTEARFPELAGACRQRRAAVLYGQGSLHLASDDASTARRYIAGAISECWHARWKAPPMLVATLLPRGVRNTIRTRATQIKSSLSAGRRRDLG